MQTRDQFNFSLFAKRGKLKLERGSMTLNAGLSNDMIKGDYDISSPLSAFIVQTFK